MTSWISVKDRLPDNADQVLAWAKHGDAYLAYFWPYPDNRCGDKQNKWCIPNYEGDHDALPDGYITHWMQIEPPAIPSKTTPNSQPDPDTSRPSAERQPASQAEALALYLERVAREQGYGR